MCEAFLIKFVFLGFFDLAGGLKIIFLEKTSKFLALGG